MRSVSLRSPAIGATLCAVAVLAFCSDLLLNLGGWGHHDWDYFFWTHLAACRSLLELHEWPLWNPWTVGGLPFLGNPQSQIVNPWFLLDLTVGPVLAFKLTIVAHYAICLGGMYWLGRELGLSRLAAVYAAGTFTFSTWLALRVFSGHYTFISFAYLPWIVGLLHRTRVSWKPVVPAGLLLGLMILHGTWEVVLTGVATGLLAVFWGLQFRTLRFLASLALIVVLGASVSAVKVIPALDLMRVHVRKIETQQKLSLDRLKTAPTAEEREIAQNAESAGDIQVVHGSWAEGTRLEPLGILVKTFFGRQQRGVTRYFVRSYGWHEYGAYFGLLGATLCLLAPFVRRDAWPWMLLGGLCFVLGLGSFSRFAPYYLLHELPVFRSMRSAPRFFIPALFAGCILAAKTLDAVRSRLGRRQTQRDWVAWIIPAVTAIALIDSFLVGRYALHGAFDRDPPAIPDRLTELRTVQGDPWHTAPLMLSNRAIRNGYEPLEITTRVRAESDPDYRGEHEFIPDPGESPTTTHLEAWSPNTVKLRVDASGPGLVVLNRNWDKDWRTNPSFPVINHEGLVAARVPKGTHVVEFAYDPPTVKIGAIISLISILGCLLAPWIGRTREAPTRVEEVPAT